MLLLLALLLLVGTWCADCGREGCWMYLVGGMETTEKVEATPVGTAQEKAVS